MTTQDEKKALRMRAQQMREEAAKQQPAPAAPAKKAEAEVKAEVDAEALVTYAEDDTSDEAIAWRVKQAAANAVNAADAAASEDSDGTDPDAEDEADDEDMEVVNSPGGAIVKPKDEPDLKVVPFAEDVVPWLAGLETAPPVLANTEQQMKLAESIREQFKGLLPESAIDAMIQAGVGTIQKLSDVESFFAALPHAYRLQSLTLELRRALRAIEAESVQLCDDYNKAAPPDAARPSIVFSLRTGQFVTAYEQHALNAAHGDGSGVTKRKRRSSAEIAAESTTGGIKKNKTRPSLYQFAAYQKMGKNVVPGFMMKYDEARYYFALLPDGATAMKIVEASFAGGKFEVVAGGQEFTAISSVASHVARGTSVNGWDMVQWPDPGKPAGWTDRKDSEYPARVLNWATTNHVGLGSSDGE